ncbi:MAG: PAS domain S-box protein, partial [Methanoregulaceae archaeon]
MVLSSEVTAQIKEVLEKHPEGLSITDLVKSVDINRNTAGRYLENLLLSGQVEMRRFGMAKMYTLAKRLPVSSVLSISSELVMQLVHHQRIIYANDKLLTFLGASAKDLFGKNLEFTQFAVVFEDVYPELLDRFRRGLKGEEWHGELSRPVQGRSFFCRVAPTVSNEGTKGVSVLLEDITDQKRDEVRIRESEARLRSIFTVSPVGIAMAANRIFLEVNDRFCQITGYSPAELVGKSARILYASDEVFEEIGTTYMRQIRERGSSSTETQWVRKDGTVIDINLGATALDPANISGGITFTALDVTESRRAEKALRESEANLQLALDGSEMGMWEIEIPSMKGSIDERAAAILGYQKSDIGSYRADWDTLSHPDDVPFIHQRLIDHLEGRASIFESEHRMRHTSGRWIWVVGRGKITRRSNDGLCTRISGTMQDITERKRAERALRESEAKLQLSLAGSEMGMWEIDISTGKGSGDERCSAIFGYRKGDEGRMDMDWEALTHPDDLPLVQKRLADHLSGRTPMYESEHRMRHSNGKWIWIIGRGRVTPSRSDGTRRILGTMLDVTAHRQAEQALRESEQKYRYLVEQSLQGLTILQNGRPVFANSAMLDISGYSHEEYLALSAGEMIATVHPDDRSTIAKVMADRLKGKKFAAENEFRIQRKDGEIRWVLTHGSLISYRGTPAVQITYFDITDRKQAEQALFESEEKFRSIVDTTVSGIGIHQEGIIRYINPAGVRILGYAGPEEIVGRQVMDFVAWQFREEVLERMDTLSGGMAPVDFEQFVRKDGILVDVEVTGAPFRYNEKPAVLVVFSDITKRKLAEDALKESEDRYRKLVEISPNAVLLHRDGKVIYANRALARILGTEDADDFLGKNVLDLIHPADREAIRTNIAQDLTGAPTPFMELRMIRADGSLVFVEGRGVGTTIDGKPAVLVAINDITGRYRAVQALKESEERYRNLAEASQDIIFLIGRDDRVEYVNSYAAA